MIYEVTLAGEARTVEVVKQAEGWRVRVDDGPWTEVSGRSRGQTWWLDLGEGTERLHVHVDGEQVAALRRGLPLLGTVVDPRAHALDAAMGGGEGRIVTEMPGAVVRVPVKVGDTVHTGQVLVVVEAMKMENEFKATFDGVVAEVLVDAGQSVDGGTTLVVVEPAEG